MKRSRRLAVAAVWFFAAVAGCTGGSGGGGGGSTAAGVASATPTATSSASPGPTPAALVPAALKGDPLSPLVSRGGELRDARGRHVLLRGANYAGRAKWPPFTGWARRTDVDAIAALGLDHVRFLVSWHAIEPTDGVFDDAYLDEVVQIFGWFEAAGIRVIVDMHQDQYAMRFGGNGFPEWTLLDPDPFPGIPDIMAPFPFNYANPKVTANFDDLYASGAKRARLARVWSHVVARVKGCAAVAGYDLLNEPWFGLRSPTTFESQVLHGLNEELCAAVRAQDPRRVVFFEPQLEAGLFVSTGLRTMSDPNVVYAPHWYDVVVDARHAAGLQPDYDGNPGSTTAALDRLLGHGRALGCPTWIGEYGVQDFMTGQEEYLADHNQAFDERLLSACAWTIDTATPSTYSCLDQSGQPKPIADQWAHPHPRAVAGTLERTAWDPATRTLEVRWREGGLGPDAPTIVELPLHHVPGAAPLQVTLSDPAGTWRFERDATTGRLLVWADAATPVHTLTVRPQ